MNQKHHGREAFLERLKHPECPSISVLSEELNIPKATLYAWSYLARKTKGNVGMKKKTTSRSPIKKFALLAGSDGLKGKELQEYCEVRGVSLEELLSWRDLALSAIDSSSSGAVISKSAHDQMVAQFEKELSRKNEALAETAALLVLQKKTSEIFRRPK